MGSPIASPQNLFGLQNMHPPLGWMQWMAVSIPVSFASILVLWRVLLASYKPDVTFQSLLPLPHSRDNRMSAKQWFIIAVTAFTVIMWCLEPYVVSVFGNMAVIALIPLIVFGATGILSKDDINCFLWTVVLLGMGGIALGSAIQKSGLLAFFAGGIKLVIMGHPLWLVLLSCSGLLLVASTFVSHSVSAIIILPLIEEIGRNLPGGHSRLLVFCSALVCSAGMGLPASGFPNMSAAAQEDSTGRPYLCSWDFVKVGIPSSIIAWLLIVTIGYLLMMLIGL